LGTYSNAKYDITRLGNKRVIVSETYLRLIQVGDPDEMIEFRKLLLHQRLYKVSDAYLETNIVIMATNILM